MYVEYHQRHEHVLWIDLVDGLQSLVEVSGRIDVRPPLPHVAEFIDVQSGLVNGVERADFHFSETLPVGRRRAEGMGEIHELLGSERDVNLVQCRLAGGVRRAHDGQTQGAKDTGTEDCRFHREPFFGKWTTS